MPVGATATYSTPRTFVKVAGSLASATLTKVRGDDRDSAHWQRSKASEDITLSLIEYDLAMPRRSQLADVADGITGHAITPPWLHRKGDWSIWAIPPAVRNGLGLDYQFDLLKGIASPSTMKLDHLASALKADLARHLKARNLNPELVASASLTLTLDDVDWNLHPATFKVQVQISDDRGRNHTSTRRSSFGAEMNRKRGLLGTLLGIR